MDRLPIANNTKNTTFFKKEESVLFITLSHNPALMAPSCIELNFEDKMENAEFFLHLCWIETFQIMSLLFYQSLI